MSPAELFAEMESADTDADELCPHCGEYVCRCVTHVPAHEQARRARKVWQPEIEELAQQDGREFIDPPEEVPEEVHRQMDREFRRATEELTVAADKRRRARRSGYGGYRDMGMSHAQAAGAECNWG